MLQISTGRFARDVELYETVHRSIIFTNLRFLQSSEIDTVFGKFTPSSVWGNIGAIMCQYSERLEAIGLDGSKNNMISTGGSYTASDLAVVLSFCLNATCTTDAELTKRLISEVPPMTGGTANNKFLKRTFDKSIIVKEEEVENLKCFFNQLLNLKRKDFESVINAMRRYVLATHRMAEEPSLAYVLLVMALESLIQKNELSEPQWREFEESKRLSIDKILKKIPETHAQDLRSAILKGEHTKVTRQFHRFVNDHIDSSYYRKDAAGALRPMGRLDVPNALKNVYNVRSKYVHELTEIPRVLWSHPSYSECTLVDRNECFTFEGLARLVRHVVNTRIERLPKVEVEHFNYHSALPNIILAPLASKYWIWRPEGFNTRSSRRRFSALLEQYVETCLQKDKPLTDLTKLLKAIEQQVPQLKRPKDRRPMLAIYYLYNTVIVNESKSKNWNKFFDSYSSDFNEPCIEEAAIYLVFNNKFEWDVSCCELIWQEYIIQRLHKYGLKLPNRIEAAFLLLIGEKHRLENRQDKACAYVADAVEIAPELEALLIFETKKPWELDEPFPWFELTLSSDNSSEE